MAIVTFFQTVGSAIGVAAGQNILDVLLLKTLPKYAPTVEPKNVLAVGAYSLAGAFGPVEMLGVQRSYRVGLRGAWAFAFALTGYAFVLGFLGCGRILNRSLHRRRLKKRKRRQRRSWFESFS